MVGSARPSRPVPDGPGERSRIDRHPTKPLGSPPQSRRLVVADGRGRVGYDRPVPPGAVGVADAAADDVRELGVVVGAAEDQFVGDLGGFVDGLGAFGCGVPSGTKKSGDDFEIILHGQDPNGVKFERDVRIMLHEFKEGYELGELLLEDEVYVETDRKSVV